MGEAAVEAEDPGCGPAGGAGLPLTGGPSESPRGLEAALVVESFATFLLTLPQPSTWLL